MIFQIIMSGGPPIPLEDEDAVRSFLDKANDPSRKLILTKHGLVNTSFVVSIVPYREKNKEVEESLRIGRTKEEAVREVLGVSQFAKLLSPKLKMLSDKSRTEAQEEAGLLDKKR